MNLYKGRVAVSALLALLLAACGSSGSGSGSGSNSVSKGEITAKSADTITVNQAQVSTTDAQIITEDAASDDTALSVGMVVTIRSSDGVVDEIEYDEEMEGPISDAPTGAGADLSFTVLGTTVTVNADTVYESTYSAAAIAMLDVVEVSGFYQADGSLLATYIEREGTYPAKNEAEIRGIISNLSAAGDEFTIGGATIKVVAGTEIEGFPGGLANGVYAEAEGELEDGSFTVILASEVENETEDDGSEVELEGVVTDYISDADFMVNGTKVDATGATREPLSLVIANGVMVEVEGKVVDGVLIANEIEEEDEDS